jgi:hypothetical protein
MDLPRKPDGTIDLSSIYPGWFTSEPEKVVVPEGCAEVMELRKTILKDLRSQGNDWYSRKSDAPGDSDYWWECKACWSIFYEAERLVEKVDTLGTLEEYKARVASAVSVYENWGRGENWEYWMTQQAEKYVKRTIGKHVPI